MATDQEGLTLGQQIAAAVASLLTGGGLYKLYDLWNQSRNTKANQKAAADRAVVKHWSELAEWMHLKMNEALDNVDETRNMLLEAVKQEAVSKARVIELTNANDKLVASNELLIRTNEKLTAINEMLKQRSIELEKKVAEMEKRDKESEAGHE